MTMVECPECDGQGHYSTQRSGRAGPGLGYEDVEAECSECNGTGKVELDMRADIEVSVTGLDETDKRELDSMVEDFLLDLEHTFPDAEVKGSMRTSTRQGDYPV